jgi:hypothetical protein
MAVGGALLGEGAGGGVAILDPLAQFARGAATDVTGKVGLAAELFAEIEELVRADGVAFDHAAPVRVDAARAFFTRADAVTPVVVVGITAAGPAQVGNLDLLQRGDEVAAPAPDVGHRGAFADPKSVVDATTEMLGKMAEDMPVDDRTGLGGMDGEVSGHRGCS